MTTDRESHIAFDMNYCQHYKPMRGSVSADYCSLACGASARMKAAREAGEPNMTPCIGGHKTKDVSALCPNWIRRTREMGEERADEFEKAISKLTKAGPFISAWRHKPKPTRDRIEVVECPVCKGKLRLSQSSYNGHVHAHCSTADCISFME